MKPIIVVPMAGNGTRFSQAGYQDPKPLIEFLGKRMIQHVVESFPLEADWVFIVQQGHIDEYQVDEYLRAIKPACEIVSVGYGATDGAARSMLMTKSLINNERPLGVLNSDNIINWNAQDIFNAWSHSESDGLILVFHDKDPKWSFAKLGKNGYVAEVAEKKPISDYATAGLYFWKRGQDFVKAAEQMIEKNIRVNGEFYLAPVYNENILNGEKISLAYVTAMHGVGTPEDLEKYVAHRSKV
jgi:dTDP-glucose pyrophosphorylase